MNITEYAIYKKLLGGGGGGSSSILQEKTFTANGSYTPDSGYDGFSKVTVNVESEQPTLYAPTISFDSQTTTLTITNNTRNGGFVSSYEVYSNDTLAFTTTNKSIVLINNMSFTGSHTIKVKAVGTNFINSANSNSVVWQLLAPTISLKQTTLTITDEVNNANIVTGYNLYINDSLVTSIISQTIDLSTYGIASGDTIKVCAMSNGVVSAFSNVLTYATNAFSDQSWSDIATAVKSGSIPSSWAVGDTKSVTLTNGETFTIRLCDLQSGRYAYADGSGSSKAVFEFVELQPTNRYMNSTGTTSGGWASSYMRNTVMGELYALLPSDLQGVISEVNVLSSIGDSNTTDTSTSANKLFLPAMRELFSSESHSIGLAECPLGQFDYYANNDTSTARTKYALNSTLASIWWTRSPYKSNSTCFCYANSSGYADYDYAARNFGVAPVFAI